LWKPFSEVYDKAPIPMYDRMDELIKSPYVKKIMSRYGTQKGEDALQDVIKRVDGDWAELGADAGTKSAWGANRASLSDMINTGFKSVPEDALSIRGEMANAIKQHMDVSTAKLADPKTIAGAYKAVLPPEVYERLEKNGFDGEEVLKVVKERWPAIKMLQSALLRDKVSVTPFSTTNSDTAARSIMNAPNPATALFNAAGGQLLNKGLSMGTNAIATGAASGIRNKMTPENIARVDAIAKGVLNPTLPPALQAMLGASGKVGVAGAERAGMIPQAVQNGLASDEDTNQASLTGEPKVPMMQPIPIDSTTIPTVAGTAPDPIAKGLETAWLMQDPQGIIEESQPGSKEAFMNAVRERLNGPDGTPDLRKAGKVIFAGQPDKAKAFTEAYDAFDKIQKGLPDAVKGALTGFDQKAELNKQVVKDTVVGLLKKGDGMDAKLAEGKVDGILNSLDAPAVKSAKILALIQAYDKRFAPGGVLESAGISLRGTE